MDVVLSFTPFNSFRQVPFPRSRVFMSPSSASSAALDGVPPVASLSSNGWQPTNIIYRTPEHLGTVAISTSLDHPWSSSVSAAASTNETDQEDLLLHRHPTTNTTTTATLSQSFSAPPLVFRKRFLISACSNGMIVGWDLYKLEKIQTRLNQERSATISSSSSSGGGGDTRGRVHPKTTSMDTWETLAPDFQWSDSNPKQPPSHVFIVQIVPAPKSLLPSYDDDEMDLDDNKTDSETGGLHKRPDDGDNNETYIVAITSAGTVYILNLTAEVFDDEKSTGTTPSVSSYDLKTVLSWNTTTSWDLCSVAVTTRCCTIRSNDDGSTTTTTTTNLHMGYQRGKLETWTVVEQQQHSSPDPSVVINGTIGKRRPSLWKPQMLFRAVFMDQKPDIVGIARLGDRHSIPENHEYLVLMLRHDRGIISSSTAECQVEVIDITTAAAVTRKSSSTTADPTVRLVLEEMLVFPQPGREVFGPPTTITKTFPYTFNSIPSRGTNAVLTTDDGMVAVTTSEGMVILIDAKLPSSLKSKVEDDYLVKQRSGLLWGVSRETDQHILSYPPVGIGSVIYEDHRFIAVCLRGTTTYLIATESPPDSDGTVYSFRVPIDIFGKNHKFNQLYQIENFATGNLRTNNITTTRPCIQQSISLLLYAWPGGTIDVYSCGLLKDVLKE